MTKSTGYSKHVVQYSGEYSFCAGCNSCEAICSLLHDGLVSPSYNRIFVDNGGTRECVSTIYSCQQCEDHPCYEACPKKDVAICVDEDGITYIVEEECIGCGACIRKCKFDPPRINMAKKPVRKEWRAKKCDLCRTRPEGPACVEYCPVRCLGISTEPEGHVTDPEYTNDIVLSEM